MKSRPILFNGEMVRAILEGRKTVTRRPVTRVRTFGPVTEFGRSGTPGYHWHFRDKDLLWNDMRHDRLLGLCPFGVPGDKLWVKETWGVGTRPHPLLGWVDGIEYRADEAYLSGSDMLALHRVSPPDGVDLEEFRAGWHPSIHMHRWASRLTLRVEAVGVERVQDISSDEALAEGFEDAAEFLRAWIDIYGIDVSWAWVVRFSVITPALEV